MVVVWHTGKVIENQILSHKFRCLKMKVVDDPEWSFVAGQFVLMKMGRPDKINSYSPCNVPGRGKMEVLIDITPADMEPPAGAGSRFVRDLVVGDKVEFAGAAGGFVYKNDNAASLWFVATGSGVSSLWSIIRERLIRGDERKIRLWWGLRHKKDMIWEDELAQLCSKYPNFSFEYVLSQPDGQWSGLTGHVTEQILGEAEKLGEEERLRVSVYLCGNKDMIDEVSVGLVERGVNKERVYWEKYF